MCLILEHSEERKILEFAWVPVVLDLDAIANIEIDISISVRVIVSPWLGAASHRVRIFQLMLFNYRRVSRMDFVVMHFVDMDRLHSVLKEAYETWRVT